MKNFKISILLMLSLLSACASYNDVKLNVLDAETKEPLGDTYIVLDNHIGIIPSPFRQQKLYKTDSKGELIIDRDGDFDISAIRAGYASSIKHADTYKNSDPTKDGFVPKTMLMQKSTKPQSLRLRLYIIKDYDCDALTKEFIDYCLANNISIYRDFTRRKFNIKDDR